jgi:hypothetical protein
MTPYELEIDAAVEDVATVWTIPRALIQAIIQQESAFDPMALSRGGAVGLMQILPRNAAALGVAPEELWLPKVNVLAGTRLLAILLRHYQGDVISALVAYNARPRKLFAPLPANGETGPYVRRVVVLWRFFQRCHVRLTSGAPVEVSTSGAILVSACILVSSSVLSVYSIKRFILPSERTSREATDALHVPHTPLEQVLHNPLVSEHVLQCAGSFLMSRQPTPLPQ